MSGREETKQAVVGVRSHGEKEPDGRVDDVEVLYTVLQVPMLWFPSCNLVCRYAGLGERDG